MALSLFQYLLSCILLFTLFSDAHSSPFDFLNKLQGSQKGDKLEGLNELKQYLNKFGYINTNILPNSNVQNLQSNGDDNKNNEHIFDDVIESAIKTYQLNYHLKATGILDAKTVSNMMLPRCGVSDIINGRSRMRAAARKKMHHRHHHHHHTVSHYQFFSGSPRWPADKTNLNYMFEPNTLVESAGAISRAFDKWASATQFTFTRIENNSSSADVTVDISIGFHSRDHGDGFPFDGPFGVLGHASPPTRGKLHLDADEPWSIGPMPGHIDLETVALHEIGHLLGLEHSSVEGAIMYPSVSDGMTKDLHGDDVQGIKELYHTV